MAREYFCAYHSYLEAMEPLNDAERGRLFTACLKYSMTGEAPHLSGNERFVFPSLKGQIDRDAQNYKAFLFKQTENGKKGGRPAKAKETQKTQAFFEEPKKTKEMEKEKTKTMAKATEREEKPARGFLPPTVEEVRTYCRQRLNNVNPERFVDFYTSKGWMVGKTKMQDWKACVRNWERDEMPRGKKPGPMTYRTESSIDMDKVRAMEFAEVPVYGKG